jgi:glucose/arabinose dehydrogenase
LDPSRRGPSKRFPKERGSREPVVGPSAQRSAADLSGTAVGCEHGSWNRNPRSGYKVVFVRFVDGQPAGKPLDVLTGFVSAEGDAFGRPVGVAIDRSGALLVADDVGNAVWRVVPAAQSAAIRK